MSRFSSIASLAALALTLSACTKEAAKPAVPASSSTTAATAADAPAATEATATTESAPLAAMEVGSTLPPIVLADLDGRAARVVPGGGQVILLNMWATWCGPCRAEIPELKRLQKEHATEHFSVVGVSVDAEGTADDIRQFMTSHAVDYLVLHDPDGKSVAMFQSSVIPTSALVDRTGKVVWIGVGALDAGNAEFGAALSKALKG